MCIAGIKRRPFEVASYVPHIADRPGSSTLRRPLGHRSSRLAGRAVYHQSTVSSSAKYLPTCDCSQTTRTSIWTLNRAHIGFVGTVKDPFSAKIGSRLFHKRAVIARFEFEIDIRSQAATNVHTRVREKEPRRGS